MKLAMKYASRMWGIYAVMIVLCILFLMSASATVLGIILNVALLIGFGLLLFNEGGYNGEKACTLQASLDRQIKEGRSVDQEQYAQTFSKKNALRMFLVMIAPFVIVALINLAVFPLYPEPDTDAAALDTPAVSSTGFVVDDVTEPDEGAAPAPTNWVLVVTRLLFSPFFALYSLKASLLNWLFLPLGLVFPACDAAGYLCGPRLRDKKLKDIARGKRREMRKMRREREAHRAPKAEV